MSKMRVVGYTDRLSVAGGDNLQVMVSSQRPRYRAAVVRLRHGDINPNGPGFRCTDIASPLEGEYSGKVQTIHQGSYVTVADGGALTLFGNFTLTCWVYPTGARRGPQALLGRWADWKSAGYLMHLTPEGAPALQIGDGEEKTLLCGNVPLRECRWSLVVASFDAAAGIMRLAIHLREPNTVDFGTSYVSLESKLRSIADGCTPFTMAATQVKPANDPQSLGYFFNGRLDRPTLYSRVLSSSEIDQLAVGLEPTILPGVLASWDFGQAINSARAVEISGSGFEGRVVNVPSRGVKGHNWTGQYVNFADAPQEYGAIHFHDDDLEDAGWELSHCLSIPTEWRSGVYAIRLQADEFEDYVPFIVRPARGRPTAQIALLMPTLTF